MLTDKHLWPIDDVWNYHAGGERFKDIHIFTDSMERTYGAAADLRDFERKAQAMTYDGQRAMFEAYARNKYDSTGVIQWMMNNAWPSLIWHLYDNYLQPAGGYFGTRKACEPLHLQYSYDDRGIVLVSSLPEPVLGLTVTAKLLDFDLHEVFSKEVRADIDADGVETLFALPEVPKPEPAVYFLSLSLRDSESRELSSNFYWLPAVLSTLAWDKTPDTAYTPTATYEDLTALNRLPKVKLQASSRLTAPGGTVEVTLHNPSKQLAFQIRASVEEHGREVLPVLWDDNYVTLLPGETRVLHASYLAFQKPLSRAEVRVGGWNSEMTILQLGAKAAQGKP
jgi:exo-1,4-beta-D-glucosaminidase